MHKVSENIDQILKYKQKMSFLAQICLINPDFGALKNIFKNLAYHFFLIMAMYLLTKNQENPPNGF